MLWHLVIEEVPPYHWTACGKPIRPKEPGIPFPPDPMLDGPMCPTCKRKAREVAA